MSQKMSEKNKGKYFEKISWKKSQNPLNLGKKSQNPAFFRVIYPSCSCFPGENIVYSKADFDVL
jgi:hypothetical protein